MKTLLDNKSQEFIISYIESGKPLKDIDEEPRWRISRKIPIYGADELNYEFLLLSMKNDN